jgi:uroporphyrinogen-III synthase
MQQLPATTPSAPPHPVIILTREPEDNAQLRKALTQRGIPVLEIPCLKVYYLQPPVLAHPVDVMVFTSRHGVKGWMEKLNAVGEKTANTSLLQPPNQPLFAAIGTATAQALEFYGFQAEIIAEKPQGEFLAQKIMARLSPPARIAMVQGDLRAGAVDEVLTARGFQLVSVPVYRNMVPKIPVITPCEVAAIFFASPSAAKRLLSANPWMCSCATFCIGNTTAVALLSLLSSHAPAPTVMGPRAEKWIEMLYLAYKKHLH